MSWASKIGCSWLIALAACGGGDGEADEPAAEATEQRSAISATCTPPPDCLPIDTLINIDVCCSESLRCGFDLSPFVAAAPMYPELASLFEVDPEKPCWPRSHIFIELPSPAAERVRVEDAADVLISPSCQGRIFTATPLPGCCLPNNRCGYDTHVARNTFRELARPSTEAFAEPACLTASELNAQLSANNLAAFAHLPPATGTCDYAELDATLE